MENYQEMKNRFQHQQNELVLKALKENEHSIQAFVEYAKTKQINLSMEDFSYVDTIGVIVTYHNITELLLEDVKKCKEGLSYLDGLSQKHKIELQNGTFESKHYALLVSQYFRRSYSPNARLSPSFIQEYFRVNNPKLKSSILLDPHRIRIGLGSGYREFDTWYGAVFNRDILLLDDNPTKLRPPMDINEGLRSLVFDDIYSMDVLWSTDKKHKNIRIFELEEFKELDFTVNIEERTFYPSKYIHAEFDLDTNLFRHFDGAIHFYTEEEYLRRRDSDHNYNSKNNDQIKSGTLKLFKMDGENQTGVIDIDTWVNLTSHFLSGNHLIYEYFEGKLPDHVQDMVESIRKNPQS